MFPLNAAARPGLLGLAVVIITSAQSPAFRTAPGGFITHAFAATPSASPRRRPTTARAQTATVVLDAQNGAFLVIVESYGQTFTVDPDKLHFTMRAANANGARAGFKADVGEPVLDRTVDQGPDGSVRWYHLPIAFPSRPAKPGMYDLALVTSPGFVRGDDGSSISVEGAPKANVYWPDETATDGGLRAARAAIDRRTVYGYGGIQLNCGIASFKSYLADVGVMIQGVERTHGIVQLWTGAMPSWGNDAAYSFFAVDPLAVTASYPTTQAFASGSASGTASEGPCPGFYLADPWHLEVTLTTAKPPPMPGGYDQLKIAAGMTRAEVARRRGYPQGYYTASALNVMPVWSYYDGPGDAYTVTFREGRVITYTVPIGLP